MSNKDNLYYKIKHFNLWLITKNTFMDLYTPNMAHSKTNIISFKY